MISWENWQTLLAVYRASTYAGAATSLHIDATTVGRRIKHLEQRLGGSLFARHEGKLIPSDRCTGLLAQLEAASESLRSVERETLAPASSAIWREVRIAAAPFLVSNLLAPDVASLTRTHQLRVELLGTGNNVSLSRRESDIALRIEDGHFAAKSRSDFVVSERIGALAFGVYSARNTDASTLPWAGIIEQFTRSAGTQAMHQLAGNASFQYKVRHFDTLLTIVRAGAAKALLPEFLAKGNEELVELEASDLSLPLWMLSHRQDRDVVHLQAARDWIVGLCQQHL